MVAVNRVELLLEAYETSALPLDDTAIKRTGRIRTDFSPCGGCFTQKLISPCYNKRTLLGLPWHQAGCLADM